MSNQYVLLVLFLLGYIMIPLTLLSGWLVRAARHQNHRIVINGREVKPTEVNPRE